MIFFMIGPESSLFAAALGEYVGVKTVCAIGGQSLAADIAFDIDHVNIMYDLIRRKILNTSHVRCVVLDEVDVMLSVGFKDQVHDIFRTLPVGALHASTNLIHNSGFCRPMSKPLLPAPHSHQVCMMMIMMSLNLIVLLFTEVLAIAGQFLRDPVEILVPVEEVPLDGIKQFYVDCGSPEAKFEVLCDLFEVCIGGIIQIRSQSRSQAITSYTMNIAVPGCDQVHHLLQHARLRRAAGRAIEPC